MTEAALEPGWRRVKIGDVVRLSKGRCADLLAAGLDRYVGLEHLEPGDLRIRRWGSVADGTTFTNVFKPGQVLFGKRRAYQRKVAVADFSGVCSGDDRSDAARQGIGPADASFLTLRADGLARRDRGRSIASTVRKPWDDPRAPNCKSPAGNCCPLHLAFRPAPPTDVRRAPIASGDRVLRS